MHRALARAAILAVTAASAGSARAEAPVLAPCDALPAAVFGLATASAIEAFGLAPEASLAVAAVKASGDGGRSVIRFAREGEAPEDVKLAGRVPGLAVTPDGKTAYAIVRVTDRKGALRTVELMLVDLGTARLSSGATLPVTASGLAVGADGSSLLVASRDEIRTFVLPTLASGPLYRALGDNVGVAPIAGSSYVLIAQSSRIVLADLAAPQGRDGLVLSEEAPAPAPLRGMLASTGNAGPIALAEGGRAWCVKAYAPPQAEPPRVAAPPAPPPPVEAAPVVAAPRPAEAPAVEANFPEPPPVETKSPDPANFEPGSVFGGVSGPALSEVAAIVLLGPDNVLREAARAIPDERGRYRFAALPPGGYRLVAAGRGGRVLICDPSFITLKVAADGAVEAPVLKIVSAQ